MGDLISVILPVYNGESYIEDSIRSILGQTHQNFELIIINDGSTDNSDKIIKGFLKSNKILYQSRENKGLAQTLNDCIRLSSGDYIARMDQDDISLPKRLELQLSFIQKNNIDICGSNYQIIDEKGNITKNVKSYKNNIEIILSAMMVPFIHPSVMCRNIFKEKNIFYDNNYKIEAEDYDLWIKMFKQNIRFGNINETLISYRILKTSMSRINHDKIYVEVYTKCKKFNKEFQQQLFNSFMKIKSGDVETRFIKVMFKSVFNFIKVNGLNTSILMLFFRFNFKYSIVGFGLFMKQEILYLIYKLNIKTLINV
jgi:glycosyltransferase involved in cell wall biosynthesis